MRNLIPLIIFLFVISCNNTAIKLNIDEFNWQISLPNELIKTDIKEIEQRKKDGLKIIEDNYNQKFYVTAQKLFNYHYANNETNSITAQFKVLDSTKSFINEFKRSNEIMVSSIINKLPKAKLETRYSTKLIDGLVFQVFELNIPSNDGINTTFINYSRLFDNNMLDIIIVYQDSLKGNDLLIALENSTFN